MKRIISIILSVAIIAMSLSLPVFAEDKESNDTISSVKDFFGSAAAGIADAAADVFNTASGTLSEKADALGVKLSDLLENANGVFSSASEWTRAFISEQGDHISEAAAASYENLSSWLSVSGENSLDVLHIAFDNVAKSMGIVGDSAEKLWDTIQYYAEINNITPATMVKLALSIMTMILVSHVVGKDTRVGQAAEDYVINTLTIWFESFHVTDQESADKALAEITESVDSYMDENTWVCKSCGQENHGKYCFECGAERPKAAETWVCENCGEKNQGRFCSECGQARPIEQDDWVCVECGQENVGNYCTNCGASCPAVEDTWVCRECGQTNLGRFCTDCGAPRTDTE